MPGQTDETMETFSEVFIFVYLVCFVGYSEFMVTELLRLKAPHSGQSLASQNSASAAHVFRGNIPLLGFG